MTLCSIDHERDCCNDKSSDKSKNNNYRYYCHLYKLSRPTLVRERIIETHLVVKGFVGYMCYKLYKILWSRPAQSSWSWPRLGLIRTRWLLFLSLILYFYFILLQNFQEHRIDGSSLPLLSEDHLTGPMGMKLGPALKLRAMLARKLGACTVCLHCTHCHQTPLPVLNASGATTANMTQTPGRRPSSTGNWQTVAETPGIEADPNRALRIERRVSRPMRKTETVFKKPIKQ